MTSTVPNSPILASPTTETPKHVRIATPIPRNVIMLAEIEQHLPPLHNSHDDIIELVYQLYQQGKAFKELQVTAETISQKLNRLEPHVGKIGRTTGRRPRATHHFSCIERELRAIRTAETSERLISLMVMVAEYAALTPLAEEEDKENDIVRLMSILSGPDPFPHERAYDSSDDDESMSTSTTNGNEDIPPLPEIAPPPTLDEETDHLRRWLEDPACQGPKSLSQCMPPVGYCTLRYQGEKDEGYWKDILTSLIDKYHNDAIRYSSTDVPLFAAGPDHAKFFIGHKKNTHEFFIAPTKRKVGSAVAK
jgi:hypothetical protein